MRGLACVVVFFGAGAITTVVADWSDAQPAVKPASSAAAEISAADMIAFRFPFEWEEATAAPAPAEIAASYSGVVAQQALLSPQPTHQSGPSVAYRLASASPDQLPAMAYAPETPAAVARVDQVPAAYVAPAKPVAEPKIAAKPAAARNTRQVLNDAQISSIKKRLTLSPDQERYWPAVESALRQMAWKKSPGEKAKVDMSTVDVDGLKSAAFPLVMSFSDDQKRELRSLAHLLGLESVASRF